MEVTRLPSANCGIFPKPTRGIPRSIAPNDQHTHTSGRLNHRLILTRFILVFLLLLAGCYNASADETVGDPQFAQLTWKTAPAGLQAVNVRPVLGLADIRVTTQLTLPAVSTVKVEYTLEIEKAGMWFPTGMQELTPIFAGAVTHDFADATRGERYRVKVKFTETHQVNSAPVSTTHVMSPQEITP